MQIWTEAVSKKLDLIERNGCHFHVQQCQITLKQLQNSRQLLKSDKLLPSVMFMRQIDNLCLSSHISFQLTAIIFYNLF